MENPFDPMGHMDRWAKLFTLKKYIAALQKTI